MQILPGLHFAGAKKLAHHLVIWGQSSSWGTFSLYSRDSPGPGSRLLLILFPCTPEARRFDCAESQCCSGSHLGTTPHPSGGSDQRHPAFHFIEITEAHSGSFEQKKSSMEKKSGICTGPETNCIFQGLDIQTRGQGHRESSKCQMLSALRLSRFILILAPSG